MVRTSDRRRIAAVAGALVRDPVSVGVFVLVTVLGLLMYRVWLPIPSVGLSVVLSLAFGAVLALQAHTIRRAVRAQRAGATRRGVVGVLAFVLSCLPCLVGTLAPLVPAVFTTLGVSVLAAPHFMMANMPAILIASLVILLLTGAWSVRQLSTL